MNWLKWYFDLQYRFSKPPWDSGVTPPEVVAFVEQTSEVSETSEVLVKRRALDLGCGTGTNAIYLSQHDLQVIGVDFSLKAIEVAREKARSVGANIEFHVGDVTRLDSLGVREPFDYVLDIGCFHVLDSSSRARYAANLARLTRPGSIFQLYAFGPRAIFFREIGATPEQVKQLFEKDFVLDRVVEGEDRGGHASAWYWFRRK